MLIQNFMGFYGKVRFGGICAQGLFCHCLNYSIDSQVARCYKQGQAKNRKEAKAVVFLIQDR